MVSIGCANSITTGFKTLKDTENNTDMKIACREKARTYELTEKAEDSPG